MKDPDPGHTLSPDLVEDLIAAITDALPGVIAVYVFGSAVFGEVHSKSDLDIAILPDHKISNSFRWELQNRLSSSLGCEVDLVDLLSVPTVMRMQVVSTGAIIHIADKYELDIFETYVFSSYARLNEERRAILETVRRRGRVYG
jgi:predicted nucleotidyltransferase